MIDATDPKMTRLDTALAEWQEAREAAAKAKSPAERREAEAKLKDLQDAVEHALRAAADAAADPDPPEATPPDLVADLMADLETSLDADADGEWLLERLHAAETEALKAGGLVARPVALRRALVAAHRGDEAPAAELDAAERELERRVSSARRHERAAQLAVDRAAGDGDAAEQQRKLLRAARTALNEARTMRRTVASARVRASPVTVARHQRRPPRTAAVCCRQERQFAVGMKPAGTGR